MANSKISQLPVAQPLQSSDVIPIVQTLGTGLETRKTTIDSLRSGFSSDRIVSNNKTNTIISDDFGLRGIIGSSYYYTFEFDFNKSVIYNPRQSMYATRERLLSFDATNSQFILGERSGGKVLFVDYTNNNFQMNPFNRSPIIDAQYGDYSYMRVGLGDSWNTALEQTQSIYSGSSSWATRIYGRNNNYFLGTEEYQSSSNASRSAYMYVGGYSIIYAYQDLMNSQNKTLMLQLFGYEILRADNDATYIRNQNYDTNINLGTEDFYANVYGSNFLHAHSDYNSNSGSAALCNPSSGQHRMEVSGDDETLFGFYNNSKDFVVTGFDAIGGIPKIRVSANGQNYYIPLSI